MVFHGGQPSGKKKTTIGYRQKQGPNPSANDLAESFFAGVTAQVQCYDCIGMHSAAATSDVLRNEYLTQSITKNEMYNEQRWLFHELPEELRTTAIMVAMEDALGQSNNMSVVLQCGMKQKKEELKK